MTEPVYPRKVGLPFINSLRERPIKTSFLWKVDVYQYLTGNFNDEFESPFFGSAFDDIKCSLLMFTRINRSKRYFRNGKHFLCFEFRSENKKYFTTNVKLSITVLNNVEVNSLKITRCFKITNSDDRTTSCNKYTMIDLLSTFDLLHPDAGFLFSDKREIHVLCEYELIQNEDYESVENHDMKNQLIVLNALEKKWKNEQFCDFMLIAPCGRKLSAHRFVLSAGSPVFSAMLKNDMKEKQEGSVEITDLTYEILEEILNFMYSGKIKKLDYETVDGILLGAEKYQMSHLKNVIKEFLLKNLQIENSIKTLKLCKTFNMTDLESYVDEFVRSNAKLIYENHVMREGDETDVYVRYIHDEAERTALNNLYLKKRPNFFIEFSFILLRVSIQTLFNSETD